MTVSRSQPTSERTNYQLVTVDRVAVGTRNPATGAYTPAVRVPGPSTPIGTYPPRDRGHYGDGR